MRFFQIFKAINLLLEEYESYMATIDKLLGE